MASATRELLVDRVYQYLVAQLSARTLSLGSHLNALYIARELGTSRTTVNKVILRLEEAGWVRPDDNRRPVVVALPPPQHEAAARAPFAFANQTEKTYETILEKILRGDYPPGETLKERRLAREFGVNPVTVHRAAEWLCNDGLLVRLRRRGWQVPALRLADLKDIFRIRLLLEPLAVRGAVPRISPDKLDELEAECDRLIAAAEDVPVYERRQADYRFHQALLEASGRPVLAETLEPVLRRVLLMTSAGFRFGRVAQTFKEHKAVLQALRRHDTAGTVQRVKAHLRASLAHNVAVWERKERAGDAESRRNGKPAG
jgi:DNA-binding GntR family transcriptional regulator